MTRSLLVLSLVAPLALADRPYAGGAAAAAHPLGSAAAKEMLDQGGNAVDAAVAAAFTMAVVGPYHSGLGGGGFAIIHFAGAKPTDTAFDFREVAPGKATRDMYLVDGKFQQALSTDGPLSIAVPGAVKGYLELHAKYGKLPRAKVLAPAIRAAKNGFPVTPKFRDLATKRLACLSKDEEASRLFLKKGADGALTVPALGALIVQSDLAATLTTLATKGDAPFYSGPLGKAVVDTVQKKGGLLTQDDLAKFHTRWREPLEGSYRGHRFVSMPPPSAGGIALVETLGMIEALGMKGPASKEVEALHTFIEALRLAYVERAKVMGDPAFVDVPVKQLTSKEYIAQLAAKIDPKRATRSSTLMPAGFASPAAPDAGPGGPRNTTHISVIDAQGNAVALTTTVNFYFGSCIVAKGTGIVLNDQMDDFAGQPGTPNVFGLVTGEGNAIAPGKIPLSSMSPTLVFQKERPTEVMLALGAPGGSTIPTSVMQAMSYVIDGELGVVRAVGGGRLHHQWLPDEVWLDKNVLDPATQRALEAMGHTFKRMDAWGDVEAVMVDPATGLHTAASDPRNEGAPAGQDR
jgi:gamma-glutamyltranspeptidase / glutathione hydrolase